MAELTVYEFLEDFDNEELPHDEWIEQLEEAVRDYNEEYGTDYNPRETVLKYVNRVIKPDM